MTETHTVATSPKSFIATWLLSLLLGTLGVDRFYLGKIGTGILKLVTFGGLGVWTLIDLIMVLAGATRDKEGRRLQLPASMVMPWVVTAVLIIGSSVLSFSLTGQS